LFQVLSVIFKSSARNKNTIFTTFNPKGKTCVARDSDSNKVPTEQAAIVEAIGAGRTSGLHCDAHTPGDRGFGRIQKAGDPPLHA
jgi:hypothetical protein